jgi:hypothetical protein
MMSLTADYDDPKYTHTVVPEDEYDYDNNETFRAKYDKTYFFPLTRWVSMHCGEKITHKKYAEFDRLCSKVQVNWLNQNKNSDLLFNIWDNTVVPVVNTIMHLWDVQGELRDWIVERMYHTLLGTGSGTQLPECSFRAFDREQEYRGGLSSIEMAISNLDTSIMGRSENCYSEEEIEKANESNQGQMKYEHELDKYL